jgi:hypothetical protein
MGRKSDKKGSRREKQTLIPAFDPQALAKDIEQAPSTPTITPPFDPASYARIVDAHISVATDARDTPRTIAAAQQAAADELAEADTQQKDVSASLEDIGRAMYGCYLESNFPEALVLAERVLEKEPSHAMAAAVAERCRERLSPPPERAPIHPSSVVRLRATGTDYSQLRLDPKSEVVLYHVDGFIDAGTIAELAGIPRAETLDRLHALLDLGVLEVVNG